MNLDSLEPSEEDSSSSFYCFWEKEKDFLYSDKKFTSKNPSYFSNWKKK